MKSIQLEWPTDTDEAIELLTRSFDRRTLDRIRRATPDKMADICQELEPYVLDESGCFTREVARDIGVELNDADLHAGASFLVYLLQRHLQEEPSAGTSAP